MTTVQLGAHTVPLKAPASFLVRREIAMAVQTNAIRGLCAALGVCWAGKTLKAKYAYNPLPYGGDVFDELGGSAVNEVVRGALDVAAELGVGIWDTKILAAKACQGGRAHTHTGAWKNREERT